VAIGGEIVFALGLGFVVLGPKRMQTLMAHIARVQAQVQQARRDLADQIAVETDPTEGESRKTLSVSRKQ
jgi:hypothetical protein